MAHSEAGLEQRIKRLEDLEAIRTLKARYHRYVNDTDFERVGDLFAENASVNLGYLMPKGKAVVGKEAISAAFGAMKTNTSQSQVKQFLHTHLVEITGEDSAAGTGMLFACYGVKEESFVVAGKYIEEYQRVGEEWFFKVMNLALYFTVPLKDGWAGHKRHFLVNSGEQIPDYEQLLPNPAIPSHSK